MSVGTRAYRRRQTDLKQQLLGHASRPSITHLPCATGNGHSVPTLRQFPEPLSTSTCKHLLGGVYLTELIQLTRIFGKAVPCLISCCFSFPSTLLWAVLAHVRLRYIEIGSLKWANNWRERRRNKHFIINIYTLLYKNMIKPGE